MSGMTATDAQGVRARVRRELTGEIVEAARRQLEERGASGAGQLRAVAREVGMVSSAVYRVPLAVTSSSHGTHHRGI